MTNNADVPTTSTLLFPELIPRTELIAVLKLKLNKMGATGTNTVERFTDDELWKEAKRIVMPRPQRKIFNTGNHVSTGNLTDVTVNGKQDSESLKKRSNFTNGDDTSISPTKRRNSSAATDNQLKEKRIRKHSPIRFP